MRQARQDRLAAGWTQGRPGMTLSQRTVVTYPWDPGEAGATQTLGPSMTFGASSLPGVVATLPAGGANVKHQSVYDANLDETLTQDFGLSGVDQPILTKSTWALPTGDSTLWDYRVMQTLTGYADPTGTILDASQPVREDDFFYDTLGRLVREYAPLSGGVALPGPGGAARAAGQPPSAVLSAPSLTERALQYDPFGNVTSVGNQDNACLLGLTYDPLFAQLPATVASYPGGCGTAGLTTTSVFDRGVEEITSSVDAAGRLTTMRYDDFGRVLEVDQPSVAAAGATTKVLTATYVDVAPVRLVTVMTGYGPDTGASAAPGFTAHYRYIDGLGETRAVVDAIDPSVRGYQTWSISGVHSSYLTGRAKSIYPPMFSAGPSVAGTLPAEVTSPTGPSAGLMYDAFGRTLFAYDDDSALSMNVYRDAELSVDAYDAEQTGGSHQGALTTTTRDGHGRVASTDAHWVAGPDGQSGDLLTTATYLATGEPTSIVQTFPGRTTGRSMTYDSLGRMVTNTEPNVGTWTYAHDAEGRVVGTSDARGCGENLFYDLGGRLLAADYSPCTTAQAPYSAVTITPGTFPYPGAEESYAYNSAGFLVAQADRGRADVVSYDPAGHVVGVARSMALPVAGPAQYGVGHTMTVDQYSVTGQPMQRSVHGAALAGGATETETTTYSIDNLVAQIAGAPVSGTLFSNPTYDPSGRLLAATYGQAGSNAHITVNPVLALAGYDGNGSLTSYSLAQLVTGLPQPQALTQTALTLDLVGNPLTSTDTATMWPQGAQAMTQSYTYSDDYRLQKATSATAAGGPDTWVNPYAYEQSIGSPLYPQPTPETDRFTRASFSYDWRGNVSESSDGPTDDFFDRSLGAVTLGPGTDQIASASTPRYGLNALYDAAGNLTTLSVSKGGMAEYDYTWDEVGNLATAERMDVTGTVNESYTYSAGGARATLARTVAGGATSYTVSVFDALVLKNAKYTSDYEDDLSTEQVYLAGGIARVFNDTTGQMPKGLSGVTGGVAGNHTFLNLGDPRGSSSFVVDQGTGDAVERTSYLPYGALDCDYRDPTWLSPREDDKFNGHWDEAQVGLVYFGKRYYSPQLGRFISPDPLTIHGLAGDTNPYEFANGSPITFSDPTGLDGETVTSSTGADCVGQCTMPQDTVTGWNSQAGPPTVDPPQPIALPLLLPSTLSAPPTLDSNANAAAGDLDQTALEAQADEIHRFAELQGPAMRAQAIRTAAIAAPLSPIIDLEHATDPRPMSVGARVRAIGFFLLGLGAVVVGPGEGAAERVGVYEAGTYDALRARSAVGDGLDLHHVGQAHAMEQIVPGYTRATAPAIALPQAEHAAIPTLRGAVDMSPRTLLARDIWNLRQYTNTPNSVLQQLIELNKTMYPESFAQ
jgi:RHS repeat-associated protein